MRVSHLAPYAAVFSLFGAPDAAAIDCGQPFYSGSWENPDAELREFNRLEIFFKCRAVPLSGGGETAVIDWTVRAFNRCYPRDCVWGRSPAREDDRGRLVTDFSTFYSIRYLKIEPGGTGLRVEIFTDFNDPAVEDKTEEFYLVRTD